MALTEALRILITADTAGAVRGIENVGRAADRNLGRSEQQLDRWGNRLTTVGAGLVGLGAVAAYGLGQASRSASDLAEAVNANNVVFGDAAHIIDEFAKDSATSMGLSERAFRQAVVPIGAMLQNMGFEAEDAAEQSGLLARRAADMASVMNTDVTQALEAIQAGLRGEADPLERFGVGLNEAAVNAKAMELGLASSRTEVDASAKTQARLALIFEQTDKFANDFINTSDSMANRQRIVAAEFENLKASIGEAALPVMEDLLGVAQRGIGLFSGLNDATAGFVGTAATIGTIASLGLGGLSLLVGQALKMRGTFSDARDAVRSFTTRVGGMGRAAGIAAGAAGLAGLIVAVEQFERAAGNARAERLARDFLASGDAADVFGDRIDNGYESMIRFGKVVADVAVQSQDAALELIDQAEAAGLSSDAADALRYNLEQTATANANVAEGAGAATGAIEEQGGAATDAADAIDTYKSALDDLLGKYLSVEEATGNLTIALADANEHFKTQLEESGAAGLSLDVYTEAGARNRQVLQGLVEDGVEVVSTMAEQGATSEELRTEIGRQKDRLRELATRYGLNQEVVDEYIEILSRVPTDIDTVIDVRSNASRAVEGVLSQFNRVPFITTKYIDVVQRGGFGQRSGGLQLHEGGYVPGPRGQEVAAILQAGERVLSLAEVDAMSRGRPLDGVGGGGGFTGPGRVDVHLTISGDGALAEQFQRSVRSGEIQLRVGGERVAVG